MLSRNARPSIDPVSRLLLVSVTFAVLALGCATRAPYQEPAAVAPISVGSSETLAIDRVFVIFDASGSIDPKEVFPGGKAFVEAFVRAMPDGSYDAVIVAFGGDERQGGALEPFDRGRLTATAHALAPIGEDSPLDAVLLELADQVSGHAGRSAVVVVSDGVANPPKWGEPERPALEAARAISQAGAGEVCFHTVQVGDDQDGGALLAAIAQLTPCGSSSTGAALSDASSVAAFDRSVFVTAAAPVVATVTDGDSDGDGVLDSNDACAETPIGAPVDARGCWVLQGVQFASNSAEMMSGSETNIAQVAMVLKQNAELQILVEGFTDSMGDPAYNQRLSEKRADRVKSALVAEGIDPSRIAAKGFGAENPVGDNGTAAGRAQNRRIEISVVD